MGVVPDVVGFATFSPNIDQIGNSIRGVMFAEELVKMYNFHTFDKVGRLVSDKMKQVSDRKNPLLQKYEVKSSQLVSILFAASIGDKTALARAFLGGMDMNMADYDQRTALHLACCEGHVGCVKFLLETCGVDINVKDRWGQTPLDEASRSENDRITAILKKFMVLNMKHLQIPEPIEEELWQNVRKLSD